MNLNLRQKLLIMPLSRFSDPFGIAQMDRLGVSYGNQLQQVRRYGPIAGPPRFRLSTAQKALYGLGSLLFMMIIPVWSLYQMPRWSALHNNQAWEEDASKEPKEEQ
ncbi:uncharacterized protein LOC117780733 [Drosophila innubila]|uniref:uncharacterized protein LOC117780733 n=1 Tax=Drosophila innubila TaxID=198719 RepID=UPI00148BE2E1|nr:uncharacterized protein LOC117780733 [Drosophila innubila]